MLLRCWGKKRITFRRRARGAQSIPLIKCFNSSLAWFIPQLRWPRLCAGERFYRNTACHYIQSVRAQWFSLSGASSVRAHRFCLSLSSLSLPFARDSTRNWSCGRIYIKRCITYTYYIYIFAGKITNVGNTQFFFSSWLLLYMYRQYTQGMNHFSPSYCTRILYIHKCLFTRDGQLVAVIFRVPVPLSLSSSFPIFVFIGFLSHGQTLLSRWNMLVSAFTGIFYWPPPRLSIRPRARQKKRRSSIEKERERKIQRAHYTLELAVEKSAFQMKKRIEFLIWSSPRRARRSCGRSNVIKPSLSLPCYIYRIRFCLDSPPAMCPALPIIE